MAEPSTVLAEEAMLPSVEINSCLERSPGGAMLTCIVGESLGKSMLCKRVRNKCAEKGMRAFTRRGSCRLCLLMQCGSEATKMC